MEMSDRHQGDISEPQPGQGRVVAWGDELRRVHRRLRSALAVARESVEDAADADDARDLLLYCWGFCVALTGHHRREDRALFPEIEAAYPDLADVIHRLTQDHSMIEHLIGGLQKALDSGSPTEEKLRHLDGIEAVMETHFRYEERQLITVLDAMALGGDVQHRLGPLA